MRQSFSPQIEKKEGVVVAKCMHAVMVRVETWLLEEAHTKFPETKGLTATGLVDYLIRKALKETQK